MESSSPCSGFLTLSGKSSTEAAPRETLPIQPDRINKVRLVSLPCISGYFSALMYPPPRFCQCRSIARCHVGV